MSRPPRFTTNVHSWGRNFWNDFRACSCTHWSKNSETLERNLAVRKMTWASFLLSPLTGQVEARNLLPGRWLGMACMHACLCRCWEVAALAWTQVVGWFGSAVEAIRLKRWNNGKLFQSCIVHYLLFARRVLVSLWHTHSSGPAVLLAPKRWLRIDIDTLRCIFWETSHQLRENLEASSIMYVYTAEIVAPQGV